MTARRRRRSGSGPSATALIAWAGGARVIADHASNMALSSAQPSVSALVADRAGPLSGRLRGLAAGSLLACGSVLAVTVHAGDGSFGSPDAQPAPAEDKLPSHASPGVAPSVLEAKPAAPAPVPVHTAAASSEVGAGSSGGASTRGATVPGGFPTAVDRAASSASAHTPSASGASGTAADRAPAADPISRALAPVREAPARAVEAARSITAPVMSPPTSSGGALRQVIEPAQRLGPPVQQVALPVQRLAAPVQQAVAPVRQVTAPVQGLVPSVNAIAPLEDVSQPAMSMLPGSGLALDSGVSALSGLAGR